MDKQFSKFIEGIYEKHDKIQANEEKKIKRTDGNLQTLESVADQFEQKMEQAAFHIEEWLKNRDNAQI